MLDRHVSRDLPKNRTELCRTSVAKEITSGS